MFGMADSNKDGQITMAEATAAATAHFDRADANHDGTLTPDEMRAAHQAMRGKNGR
jgi:Ca2+-binding EF-hand superfamily protein